MSQQPSTDRSSPEYREAMIHYVMADLAIEGAPITRRQAENVADAILHADPADKRALILYLEDQDPGDESR